MITLLTYPTAFGRSSASPFGVKAEWLLNLSRVSWERECHADPRKMPRQKLPALRVNSRIIPDSDNIRAYLETIGADFDAGLTDRDKAASRAFIRMAEEHMYFYVVMDRWVDDRVWPIVRDEFFAIISRAVRGFVTGRIRKQCIRGLHF